MVRAGRFVIAIALFCAPLACQETRPRGGADVTNATPEADSSEAARLAAGAVPAGPHSPGIVGNALISRGKPVFASTLVPFAHPGAVNDGVYRTYAGTWTGGSPSPTQPAWNAIKVGAGPARVLVVWSAGGNYNYTDTEYGSPGAYRIETSADSTNGADGKWQVAATNANCTVRAQAHAVPFAGQSWVKLVVTGLPPKAPNGVQLDEIDVYDISLGESDTWFFYGDSITAIAFDRTTPDHEPTFAELVHTKHPGFFPAMIDGGIGGDTSAGAAAHIDAWLALNPDMRFWAIGFGTNDAAGNNADTGSFRANLGIVITKVKAAGHIPIVAKIPFSSDGAHETVPKFNEVVDDLTTQNGLPAGPDLYTWFRAHPGELNKDGIHPNDIGIKSINRLWAEATAAFYVR
jgi:acyl-CoA thioesterase-1